MNETAIKTESLPQKVERPQFKPGWYPNLSNEEYHGSAGYGSSTLKMINEMPYSKMDWKRKHPEPPSAAMQLGTAVHTMALEPDKVESEIVAMPYFNGRTNQGKADKEKFYQDNAGKLILSEADYEKAEAMADRLRAHPQIGECYLNPDLKGIAEQSVFYWYNPEDWDNNHDYRVMCKVRPDWIVPGHPIIFDLKTTRDATETEFAKVIKKLSYHLSAAMYLDGCNRNPGFRQAMGVERFEKFVWILVENEPPYECRSFELSNKDFEDGGILYHSAVRRLHQYKQSAWKGYGAFDGKEYQPITTVIEAPNWGNKIV